MDLKYFKVQGELLVCEIELKNYVEIIELVNKIKDIAEVINHHPDLFIHSYKKLKISMTTHDAGNKLTDLDFETARRIEELL